VKFAMAFARLLPRWGVFVVDPPQHVARMLLILEPLLPLLQGAQMVPVVDGGVERVEALPERQRLRLSAVAELRDDICSPRVRFR
jgi:hypothetical protein